MQNVNNISIASAMLDHYLRRMTEVVMAEINGVTPSKAKEFIAGRIHHYHRILESPERSEGSSSSKILNHLNQCLC